MESELSLGDLVIVNDYSPIMFVKELYHEGICRAIWIDSKGNEQICCLPINCFTLKEIE